MQDILSHHILPYFEYPFKYLLLNKYINQHTNVTYVNWDHISSLNSLTSSFIIRWKDKIIINFMSHEMCQRMNIFYFDKIPNLEDVQLIYNHKFITNDTIEKHIDSLTYQDLLYLYEKNILSQPFFNNYWKRIQKFHWNYFITKMPESFILANEDKIDYNFIFQYGRLSEFFIRSHVHFITDWSFIWQCQLVSESFITQYQKYISDWDMIWIIQNVSENFIVANIDKINDWSVIFEFQKLSYSFYLKYFNL